MMQHYLAFTWGCTGAAKKAVLFWRKVIWYLGLQGTWRERESNETGMNRKRACWFSLFIYFCFLFCFKKQGLDCLKKKSPNYIPVVACCSHSFSHACHLSFSATSCPCVSHLSLLFIPITSYFSYSTSRTQCQYPLHPVFAVCIIRLGGQCCHYFYVDAFNKRNTSTCEMLHGTGVFFVCLTSPIYFVCPWNFFRCTDLHVYTTLAASYWLKWPHILWFIFFIS